MIVVRVELWPGGNPRLIESIGMMTIVNETPIGSILPEDSQYSIVVDGIPVGTIEHQRSKGKWSLTLAALKKYLEGV